MPDSGRLPAAPDQAVIRLQERLTTRYQARISGALVRPATPAAWLDLPPELAPGLAAALIARGVPRLYAHQREAFDLARAGRHLVVATPTASGKTLCYNLPVLDAVLRDGRKALYLFPTKALAQDQVAELTELGRALTAAGGTGIRAYTFDGDTPGDARKAVRTRGDLVLSNPDMLHQAILPHHTKWAQFFEGLAFVVVDELHSYRGVFGSHVANVFRRLRRICRFYGVSPTFIFTSATIANPAELAQRLCGEPVAAITRSGAPQGERSLLLWNPPVINPDLGIRASARSQTTRIARMAVKSGLKTIVFARSRLMVEVITKYLKDVFDKDPRRPPRVLAYRGGYLPSDRRAAEQALRAGRVDLVVSTSALELGVDIGALDVAILNGYPGTIAATWQRLGRAGRRLRPSLGVLVATSDPLDQYLVRHPEFFFDASPEHARIHPDQLLILLEHVRCAAFELPFRDGDQFGAEDLPEMLSYLRDEGVLQRQGDQWFWVADSYPANAVSLRSVAEGNFVVIDTTGGAATIIAEVDWSSAPGTIYVGAIYMIQSQPYQVERLDWPGRKAFVTRTRADYYTDAIDYTRLKILDRFEGRASGAGAAPGGVVAQGEVHLVRRYPGYKKIRYYSHDNIGYGNIDLPDQELHTTAVWWQAQPAALEALLPDRQQAIEGFLGAAYALHHVAALRSMAELHDLGRAVGDGQGTWFAVTGNDGRGHLRGPDNALVEETAVARFEPTLFLYDNYPGGVGLSAPLYDAAETLVRDARELVAGCGCSGGCPACVGPVLPGDAERAITPRAATLRVLGLLEGSCATDAAADHGV
ncbi:MAG: DEAD/DEAH box helicase [Lamprocystis purpurea]|jgi:DEAD/DEAH box helicase domain-containing protein|uniref:DEAD/DEAH box helicase n=1 Tax=Lamprocystis purpurea TaxID=61598 RepID=UPI00035CC979|nr:DEAD/DEAH box helicase [Lamprocystis purpurea]MBV5275437.1 DEAD/DEAH box helicase [Lamprocystis purpurea]